MTQECEAQAPWGCTFDDPSERTMPPWDVAGRGRLRLWCGSNNAADAVSWDPWWSLRWLAKQKYCGKQKNHLLGKLCHLAQYRPLKDTLPKLEQSSSKPSAPSVSTTQQANLCHILNQMLLAGHQQLVHMHQHQKDDGEHHPLVGDTDHRHHLVWICPRHQYVNASFQPWSRHPPFSRPLPIPKPKI